MTPGNGGKGMDGNVHAFNDVSGWKHNNMNGGMETMRIYSEDGLRDFNFWSGAVNTANELTFEELDRVEAELEAINPDGMSDTEVNDIFWFEQDWIAEMLGYECWEALEADHAGEAWPPEDEEEEEEEDDDEEEEDEEEEDE